MSDAWQDHTKLKTAIVNEIYRRSLSLPKERPPEPSGGTHYKVEPHGIKIHIQHSSNFREKRNLMYKLQEEGYLKILDETRDDVAVRSGNVFIVKTTNSFSNLYKQLSYGKRIVEEIKNENIWVRTNIDGKNMHFFIGSRDSNEGDHVHVIIGETGEIRIDNEDMAPERLLEKIVSIKTKQGDKIKATLQFDSEDIEGQNKT